MLRAKTVTLLGYYGFDNLGDDLLLASLCQCLSPLPVNPHILSQTPQATGIKYPKARCFHRMRPLQVWQALTRSDWLILGGGGLFQDTSSLKNTVYYAMVVLLAVLLGNRVMWWAQGIGPLNHPVSRWLTGFALRISHTITVRDDQSAQWVTQLAPGKPFDRVADPVWLLGQTFYSNHKTQGDTTASPGPIGLSLRDWPNLTPYALQALATAIEASLPVTQPLVLLPFQPNQDVAPLTALKAMLNPARSVQWAEDVVECGADTTAEKVISVYSTLSGIIGMRFHAIVLGISHQLPVMALAYDPKVTQLCAQLNVPCVDITELPQLTRITLAQANANALQSVMALSQKNAQLLDNLIQ